MERFFLVSEDDKNTADKVEQLNKAFKRANTGVYLALKDNKLVIDTKSKKQFGRPRNNIQASKIKAYKRKHPKKTVAQICEHFNISKSLYYLRMRESKEE